MAGGRHVICLENKVICNFEGDVPRVDEGLNIVVHDGGGRHETHTYVVVAVDWSVDRWSDDLAAQNPMSARIHVQPI